METLLGIVVGIVASIIVSHYYFRRSMDKRLSVYRLLSTRVFDGIARDVRDLLQFRFGGKEIVDLQQIILLIANSGELAIQRPLEPLSLRLPNRAEVLDASIHHRAPESLQATVDVIAPADGGTTSVTLHFPLLNKGEFFVLKLLISGRVTLSDIPLTILAEDLPRTLNIENLPPNALGDESSGFNWGNCVAGGVFLTIASWSLYCLYLVWKSTPQMFPYPWDTFVFSLGSVFLVLPATVLLILCGIGGIGFLISALFDAPFLPNRSPRFLLPTPLKEAVASYRWRFDFDREYFSDLKSTDDFGPQKAESPKPAAMAGN